jgi:hypothetical protein
VEICDVTWEALAEYQEGHADGAVWTRLEAHLAGGCGECQTRLDWLARATSALAAPALVPAPASLQRRARTLFRERLRRPSARPWPLIARLLFDGRAAPAFVRGEDGRGPSVHRVYAVEGREIDLWEERELGDVSYIIGQVLTAQPSAPPLGAASLTAPGAAPRVATLEDNEFHLAGVPAGTYTLTLVLGEETILVPDVTVAAGTGGK